jgi:hypothetical protein
LGNPDNLFLEAYYEIIQLQTEEVLEASLIADTIIKLMENKLEWNSTATELLSELEEIAGNGLRINSRSKFWPKNPNVLSRRLNEIKTKRDRDRDSTCEE